MDRRDLLAGLGTFGIALIAGRGNAMEQIGAAGVLFIAGFGPIVRDSGTSLKLYREALGISFKEETGGYFHTGDLRGAKEFALWPPSQAAQSCFGHSTWPRIHMKIVVHGAKAALYLGGSAQPCLLINDLKLGDTQGGIALWGGSGTVGYFANLKISEGE